MPHFFLKLIGPRPTFALDMNDAEKQVMQGHFRYWKGRQDRTARSDPSRGDPRRSNALNELREDSHG
jgi:hypothetical protein